MIECTRFVTLQKGSLQGFADLYVPKWGIEIKGCSLFMKNGKRWVSMPSREYEVDGEKKYAPIVAFRNKAHMDAFSEQAKDAIDNYCINTSVHAPEDYSKSASVQVPDVKQLHPTEVKQAQPSFPFDPPF